MEKLKLYITESINELSHKVSWPTWEELQSDTFVVIVASLISAFVIFFMDFLFGANPENVVFKGLLNYVYQFIELIS